MSNETIQPKRGMAQLVQAQLVQENKCRNAFKLIQSRVLPVCEQSMMAFLPNIYMKRCENLREGQRANLEKKIQTFVRPKSLTASEVVEVGKIDSRAIMERLSKWVENWKLFEAEVGKVKEVKNEDTHKLMGSAQIYASEVDGHIIKAAMLEMALREKYVYMPEVMRPTQVEKPNRYTTSGENTMLAIRVDRDNGIQKMLTIDVSKEKTLKMLETMSTMSYFDEVMKDLQRKVCNKGNQFNPRQLYWPKRNWIETDRRAAWQPEIVLDITCNLTPMTAIPALGREEPKEEEGRFYGRGRKRTNA